MTKRLNVRGLSPRGGTAGQVPTINAAGTAVEYADPGAGTTATRAVVPLTTVLAGEPQLVWEADNSLALTEVPL